MQPDEKPSSLLDEWQSQGWSLSDLDGYAMELDESAGISASGGVSEHFDIAIIMLILIAFFVYGFGAVGRYIGNTTNSPGITAFFGG